MAPSSTITVLFFCLLVALLICFLLLPKIRRTCFALSQLTIALSFFLAGVFHLQQAVMPPPAAPLQKLASSGEEVLLSGILRTAPAYNGNKGRFVVDADLLRAKDSEEIKINSRIMIKTAFPPAPDLYPGDRLLLRARLRTPSPPGTPGSFDYRQYLADRQISITGYIRSPTHLASLPSASMPDKHLGSFANKCQRLRHQVNLLIDRAPLTLEDKALYKAIITGQRDEISVAVFENFKRSGAVHLLAISGMHMAMLALLSGLLINLLLSRSATILLRFPAWKISAAFTMIVMACYTMVSGLHPPVIRAFIMISALITALLLDRPGSMLNTVALAALLILGWDPVLLFSASFQMSFAAVTSIVLFVHHSLQQPDQPLPAKTMLRKSRKWLLDSMAVSIIALLATAPISLYHFHQISLLSPVTTILAAPLICFWALPLGLAASLLAPWFPLISGLLFSTGAIGLQGARLVTGWLAALPFAAWQLPPPSLPVIAFYYLAALLLLFSTKSRLFLASTAILFFLMMTSSTFIHFPPAHENSTMVTFIDIGQGSSTLLELPGNKNILVDGGGSSSQRFDPGEQIITPFLWHKGIRKLEAVIISHVHQDHYNGLESVIRNFKPDKVWINGSPETSLSYEKILKAASDAGAEIIVPDEETVLIESGRAKLTSMSNLHLRKELELKENNRSLLIRLEVAGKICILPGDLMAADGNELQKKKISLESDVLLAPHHGSRYSAGYDLIRLGKPEWLVVSASPFYADKFPDPSFVKWCAGKGIELINTAELGSVSFSIDDDGQMSWQPISAKAEKNTALPTDKKFR